MVSPSPICQLRPEEKRRQDALGRVTDKYTEDKRRPTYSTPIVLTRHTSSDAAGRDTFAKSPWCLAWQGARGRLALCACHKGLQEYSTKISRPAECRDAYRVRGQCEGSNVSCHGKGRLGRSRTYHRWDRKLRMSGHDWGSTAASVDGCESHPRFLMDAIGLFGNSRGDGLRIGSWKDGCVVAAAVGNFLT